MAKSKNQKVILMQARELQRTRGKVVVRSKKMIDKDFNKLAATVDVEGEKIIYDIIGFKKNFKKSLILTNSISVKESANVMNKLYKVKDKIKNFNMIESKVLNSYNKKYAAGTVTKVTKVTENKINKIVTERQKEGLGAKQIAKEVRENVKGMTKSRSLTIARTETAKASGYSNHELAKQGLSNKKVWVHTGGGKKDRTEHSDMNMLEANIDDKFPNGLLYAHEPGASAEEVISCYCGTVYKFRY